MPDNRENGNGVIREQGKPNVAQQIDPFISYVHDFSTTMRQQVASLKLCTCRSPTLNLAFRHRADEAFARLISSIEKFRRDMDLAAADSIVAVAPQGDSQIQVLKEPLEQELLVPEERDRIIVVRYAKEQFAPLATWATGNVEAKDVMTTNGGSEATPPPLTSPEAPVAPEIHFPSENLRRMSVQSSASGAERELSLEMPDEDEDGVTGKCVDGVLNPNWPLRLAWDLTTMTLVLADAMILPTQMAYKDGDPPDSFDQFWLYATTSCFAWDIMINFFTAYTAGRADTDHEPGKLVTSKARIARNYLKTWFPIDFFSTIPWGKVSSLVAGDSSSASGAGQVGKLTKVVKFARFLRLMRMMKLAKLATIWERIEAKCGSVILLQGIGLLRVLFVLVCICHWNACIWWMVGQPSSLFTEMLGPEAQESWQEEPHWTTIKRTNGPGGAQWTWLERPKFDAYIFCFYWTLGVMRTMPAEVQPVNLPERLYIMIFMFFAFSAFAICVAQITQTFFKFSERKRMFNDDMAAVRMHLRKIKAPDSLQMKVKTFLRHLYDMRRIQAKEVSMLGHLPGHVSGMLHHALLVPHLEKLTLLSGLSNKALSFVSEFAVIKDMAMGDVLCHCGCVADCAWVLISGRLQVIQSLEPLDARTAPGGNPLAHNADVVDEECLVDSENVRSLRTVVCVVACALLRVDKQNFFTMYRKFPNILNMRRTMNSIRVSGRLDTDEASSIVPRIKDQISDRRPNTTNSGKDMDFSVNNSDAMGSTPSTADRSGRNRRDHGPQYAQERAQVEDTAATAAIVAA